MTAAHATRPSVRSIGRAGAPARVARASERGRHTDGLTPGGLRDELGETAALLRAELANASACA